MVLAFSLYIIWVKTESMFHVASLKNHFRIILFYCYFTAIWVWSTFSLDVKYSCYHSSHLVPRPSWHQCALLMKTGLTLPVGGGELVQVSWWTSSIRKTPCLMDFSDPGTTSVVYGTPGVSFVCPHQKPQSLLYCWVWECSPFTPLSKTGCIPSVCKPSRMVLLC